MTQNQVKPQYDKKKQTEMRIREALARLLSTENIKVHHAAVPTPAFNVGERILYLPVWEDISESLYILMIAHEVSHALYTPADPWNKEIANDPIFKGVLNVVEDVRIEKLIQAKYPGTKKHFYLGYKELLNKIGFFGLNKKPASERNLVDRLNLHFKTTKYGADPIPFKEEEKKWIDILDGCKTFADVTRVSRELYNAATVDALGAESSSLKEMESEQGEEGESMEVQSPYGSSEYDGDRLDDDSGEYESESDQENKEGKNKGAKESKTFTRNEKGHEVDINNPEAPQRPIGHMKEVPVSQNKLEVPEIQDLLDKALRDMVKTGSDIPEYVEIPTKMDPALYIIPYKKVHKELRDYYKRHAGKFFETAAGDFEKFRAKNKPVVSHMVSLFESKKRAKLDERAKISKTGILNLSKIHTYRYNDDIFKKILTLPTGKNHGLVIFFDMSGSMQDNMVGTYQQVLNLAMFCRKVNIPFDVYGFTDSYRDPDLISGDPNDPNSLYNSVYWARNAYIPVDIGEMSFPDTVKLRQYFSSDMSNIEFRDACYNIQAIMNYYKMDRWGYTSTGESKHILLPSTERLGGTPLNFCVATSLNVVRALKEKYKVDIINAIYITDGGANDHVAIRKHNGYFGCRSRTIMFRDPVTRKTWPVQNGNVTEGLLELVREAANINAIGFFIVSSPSYVQHYIQTTDREMQVEKFKEKGYYKQADLKGYSYYYIIAGGEHLQVADEFSVDENATAGKIKRAFLKSLEDRTISRVLLSEFIDNIS